MGLVLENGEASVLAAIGQSTDDHTTQPATAVTNWHRAVILPKVTRWEYEKKRNKATSDAQLEQILRQRGTDAAEVRAKHLEQKRRVQQIVKKLESSGISARVADLLSLPTFVKQADLVVSAGGDGTFLSAAAALADNKPLIGINTDPIGSEGHLCVGAKNPPSDLIERVVDGRFKWLYRSRIRVTLLRGFGKRDDSKKVLALNDVFIGENDAAKVSYYEVGVNDRPLVRQKSSGLVVCTGTGSTSWNLSMNRLEPEAVGNLVEVMRSMGVVGWVDECTVKEIAARVNEKLIFDPASPNLSFTIREPIFNATFPRTCVRGHARKIHLKSKCSDAYLVLDGSRRIPFNHGAEVVLEIFEEDSLRTLTLL